VEIRNAIKRERLNGNGKKSGTIPKKRSNLLLTFLVQLPFKKGLWVRHTLLRQFSIELAECFSESIFRNCFLLAVVRLFVKVGCVRESALLEVAVDLFPGYDLGIGSFLRAFAAVDKEISGFLMGVGERQAFGKRFEVFEKILREGRSGFYFDQIHRQTLFHDQIDFDSPCFPIMK
jgi:hypothetical protein